MSTKIGPPSDRTPLVSNPGDEPSSSRLQAPSSRLDFVRGLVVTGGVGLAWPLAALSDTPLETFDQREICVERNVFGACNKFGKGAAASDEGPQGAVKVLDGTGEPPSELVTKLLQK
ncbi:unnamed protein product [Discosporangium mesarthrocarpum]